MTKLNIVRRYKFPLYTEEKTIIVKSEKIKKKVKSKKKTNEVIEDGRLYTNTE